MRCSFSSVSALGAWTLALIFHNELLAKANLVTKLQPVDLLRRNAAGILRGSPGSESGVDSKVVLVTVSDGNRIQKKYKKHVDMLRAYSESHGYGLHVYKGRKGYAEIPRHARSGQAHWRTGHWLKIAAITKSLRRYEYVAFFDVDNVIVDTSKKIEEFFREPDGVQIVFSGGPGFSSSHFALFRRGDISKSFLKSWWRNRKFFRANCHYDQAAFLYTMVQYSYRQLYRHLNVLQARTEYRNCAKSAFTDDTTNHCKRFQTCLRTWSKNWVEPLMQADNVTTLSTNASAAPLRQHFEILQRRANMLKLKWQISTPNYGKDQELIFSQQGNAKTKFSECQGAFSVHPVKRLSQLIC